MKQTIDPSQIPFDYTFCLKHDCSKADTCLRQLAYQVYPDTMNYCRMVNPKRLENIEEECPFYKSDEKVDFAQGFLNILGDIPGKLSGKVFNAATIHFGRRTYYRMRKGERLMTPDEQQEFIYLLKSCGVKEPQPFDVYISDYVW